jgi:hypothetical protein
MFWNGQVFLVCLCHLLFDGTGYDYPDLPGLGNNNEKLGLHETKYRNTIPVQELISRKKIG